MNSYLNKIVIRAIDEQRIKGTKYMVMGYANKSFLELMDWLYVKYGHITAGDLLKNKEDMQATYTVKDPIELLFDQIETGQESAVAGNSPFYDQQIVDMGVAKILLTQEYIHAYLM